MAQDEDDVECWEGCDLTVERGSSIKLRRKSKGLSSIDANDLPEVYDLLTELEGCYDFSLSIVITMKCPEGMSEEDRAVLEKIYSKYWYDIDIKKPKAPSK